MSLSIEDLGWYLVDCVVEGQDDIVSVHHDPGGNVSHTLTKDAFAFTIEADGVFYDVTIGKKQP